jgi:cytochrome c biogenesis protein CcmG, thiol:disulfide interchange protein DsbE
VKHPLRWVALAVAVVVVAFAVVLAANVGKDPNADAKVSKLNGKAAPSFSLTKLDGTRVTSDQLRGKTVLVNFWNSWCLPCQAELPALKSWYAAHKSDPNLVLLGVVRDDTKSAVTSFVRDQKIAWPVVLDPGGRAALDFGTRGQPETYAISPDGVVVGSILSGVTPSVLDQMVSFAQGNG